MKYETNPPQTFGRPIGRPDGRTLDDGIESLDKGGARGVLFKVTLLAYGYTFIGKGTVPAFMEDLEHEAKVYQALQPLQGRVTPIFLGQSIYVQYHALTTTTSASEFNT
ncbi:hypothetical protein PG987_004804 [Apiospora arundinis]